jgi:hypothetical protein
MVRAGQQRYAFSGAVVSATALAVCTSVLPVWLEAMEVCGR